MIDIGGIGRKEGEMHRGLLFLKYLWTTNMKMYENRTQNEITASSTQKCKNAPCLKTMSINEVILREQRERDEPVVDKISG